MDPRANRLNKFLGSVLSGRQAITPQNGALFVEAICAQSDPVTCVNQLVASKGGLASVQASMRFNRSPTFLNGDAAKLLKYLQAPELKTLGGGDLLNQVLIKIVDPPIFWTAFREGFQNRALQENGELCFAWLLLQLVLLPGKTARPYIEVAQAPEILEMLLASSQLDTRVIGQKIKHILATSASGAPVDAEYSPGGRHDNDFVDFHDIDILPTIDEITSTEPPFLRASAVLEDPEAEDSRVAIYLDNQFRLLREDMLYEMREELQIVLGKKKGNHRGFVFDGFRLVDVYCGSDDRRCNWGIVLQFWADLSLFKDIAPQNRKQHIEKSTKVLKHQSLTCLIIDGEVVAFPTIHRDPDLLARNPPCVVLQLEGEAATVKTLLKLKTAGHIRLMQINTAVFAYRPVLKGIQKIRDMPLSSELLFWKKGNMTGSPSSQPMKIIRVLEENPRQDLQGLLGTPQSIVLAESQAASLLLGLTMDVALIQGPPGTGKSFIGALLAKVLHDFSKQTILVVCYTNHALDQFLEDLMNIGIPQSHMVRLGGKSTPRTAPLALQRTHTHRSQADWNIINSLKSKAEAISGRLQGAFERYRVSNVTNEDLLGYLEFEDPTYSEAFRVPQSDNGMTQVGKKGRAVNPYYLLNNWTRGWDAGIYKNYSHVRQASEIWKMPLAHRQTKVAEWKMAIHKEQVTNIYELSQEYNDRQSQLNRRLSDNVIAVLSSKRIIGCTTTAAAMYSEDIQAASPDVVLVEEAGEILESHVLTAMGPNTKQLILIGDHKQLRPKVNNYLLTVEKDEGYDLNRSLFERLVIKGYPHEMLTEQHRMRPEISMLVRHLTYPDLVDAPKTKGRPNLLGIPDNIVFIKHNHPEDNMPKISDKADPGSTSSKQNTFEAQMILKIVRYLAQQGYGTDKIVVLTPYLGQLKLLQTELGKENDPILNDMDSYDLVRAGLMPAATAEVSKKTIRIATIDNYQGEESDIVICALTRSNTSGDIGFMSSPERLNVLLSRARNALIMIGNAETFMNSRKGKELWTQLFELLKDGGHIYDGLPVRCERHHDRTACLRQPIDFDQECPDGGCKEPCGTMLNCGLHVCPSKCHQLSDHSKMPCEYILYSKCSNGHAQSWKCHKNPPVTCKKCDREAKLAEDKRKRAFAVQQKREADELLHAQRLAELEEKIAVKTQALRDAQLAQERENAIKQKEKDLEEASSLVARASSSLPVAARASSSVASLAVRASSTVVPKVTSSPSALNATNLADAAESISKSPSQEDWQRQKDMEGASNDAIDTIMEMTGLEKVKEQVLLIMAKIDTTRRQGTSFKTERFNVVMLGNPGTGKTTIARLYAKFLTSLEVLPGNAFIETTGSRLANDGVAGVKKHIQDVINAGGGAIFVDEAYQLTSEHNFQGSQVLDFLLAEMENNIGVIVFIFAGYTKQMEKFFEHNPGLMSRVPYELKFADYTDAEFMVMLEQQVKKRYNGRMKVEDGIRGLSVRIAVRRLGRGRGREGFGNARALQNMLDKVCERQAGRLNKERKEGRRPGDFLLLKEDLIGPEPSTVIVMSPAWKKLQDLTGLATVKESIRNLIDLIDTNYNRELQEKVPVQMSLNRVFLGSPGTGKTTVAKLYGQILADLGLISNGEVVVKNPADFVGAHLGQSESNTKAILANTVGKVLIIDEAYMLYGGAGGTGNPSDPYKTAVIDTIVAEVQSVPGEDRCVLLLGYKEQMVEMFQNVNPGLSRRFAIEDAFHFEDFTDSELLEILNFKLKNQDLAATERAKAVAIEVLGRARNRPNFGNAGEVENLLGQAKARYQTRQALLPVKSRSFDIEFEPQDFDVNFNQNAHASTNLQELFKDMVGCGYVIKKLGDYQQIARRMKARGMDTRDQIPTNFVFKGPPGTGKTTVARKMGQVYYDMGFLASADVVECSASDLVGQYVGQTGPKTKKVFEKALGRVLFVDEAYRLSEGHFAKEAIDEVVDILTQERFRSKIVVILAGYDQDMNKLMAVNTGLSSRFPEEVTMRNMKPEHCLELLSRELKKKKIGVSELDDPSSAEYQNMIILIEELSRLPSWGNARDVKTLSNQMTNLVLKTLPDDDWTGDLVLSGKDAVECMMSMLVDRRERCVNVPTRTRSDQFEGFQQTLDARPPSPPSINTRQATQTSVPKPKKANAVSPPQSDGRDIGVTDEIWRRLQADKQAAETASKRSEEALRLQKQEFEAARKREEEAKRALLKALVETQARDAAELKRKQEEARLRRGKARAERERLAAAFERRKQEEEKRRQEEVKVQAALQRMGVCVAGFQWIKQASGYRCAGGAHFVGNDALGI